MKLFPMLPLVLFASQTLTSPAQRPEEGPVAISYELPEPAVLTVVIDGQDGTRVRNLVNAEAFPAGKVTFYWDGLDEGIPLAVPGRPGYEFSRALVQPGEYVVRAIASTGLEAVYEFTVYPNAGTPPWLTESTSGGWLADHAPPSAVLFLPGETAPGGKDQVLVSSGVAEAGDGLAWLDLEGKKITGFRWIGGTWTGATHLARDLGPDAHPDIYAYTAMGWNTDDDRTKAELRINALTTNPSDTNLRGPRASDVPYFFRRVLKAPVEGIQGTEAGPGTPGRARAAVRGLAVYNNLAFVVLGERDEIWVVEVSDKPIQEGEAGKVIAKLPSRGIHGITFDKNGFLYGIVGKQVKRFAVQNGPSLSLGQATTIIADGLDDPERISIGPDGSLFISDRGNLHQVKVFRPDGTPLTVIGNPGAPGTGTFDPNSLRDPAGTTVDSQGQLWVAENNNVPKRVSVWNPDGSLVNSFLGPARYGGGGFIDPKDRTRFYVAENTGLLEFTLDWEKGSSELVAVPYREIPETAPFYFSSRLEAPQNVLYAGGQRYLTNCFASAPGGAGRIITLWSQGDDRKARPISVLSMGGHWPLLEREEFVSTFPPEVVKRRKNPQTEEMQVFRLDALFIWNDTNGDGLPTPDEILCFPLQNEEIVFTINLDQTPSAWIVTNQRVLKIPVADPAAERIAFDPARAETVLTERRSSVVSSELLRGSDGSFVISAGPITGYHPNGSKFWTYHSRWPGVHASHRSPRQPEYPGQLLGTTRVLGWPQEIPATDLGQVWSVNSNYAVMYFLTTDGYFLGTIGGFQPEHPAWRMASLKRGESLTNTNFIGEHFWPTFTRTSDGNYYMVAGKNHSSIVRIDGLDSIRRLPDQSINFTAEMAEQTASAIQETARPKNAEPVTLTIPIRSTGRGVTAEAADWENIPWVTLETQRIAFGNFQMGEPFPWTEAAAVVLGDRLHVAVRTYTRDLLENTAENPPLLFKTGGGIDIQLGLDPNAETNRRDPVPGDIRLVVARSPDGKPIATLYEQSSAKKDAKPESFSSPWRTVQFDRVEDASTGLELETRRSNITLTDSRGAKKTMTREFWETSIPLATIGLTPSEGLSLRGDFGTLVGSEGETVQRHYWSNPSGGLVNDVPGEAMLTPQGWGTIQFKKQ